ncbi:GBF-interacting protein [Parasponia andersonii]|uniref:GBF-interacting protein n=1 Tax=Parasponia andersonii TaxID=3476 RepID=A0A2P5D813_PARAD|nr:GBF-interacting protein [Parasponia andersonii]
MGSESKNGVGLGELSPATRKIIQNLKEIVSNCTESEIYAVLKECNMDPDDAVQRLLSQDTFHEVKSKRERRKELKETQELRPRVTYSGLTRGIKSASEHNIGWGGSIQGSYEEVGNVAFKGDNVSVSLSLSSHVQGGTINQQPSFNSDSFNTDSRGRSIGTGDVTSTTLQPSPGPGCRSAWSGSSGGHLSMADIVRMGRPPSKFSLNASETSFTNQDAGTMNSDHYYENPSEVLAPNQAELPLDLHPKKASNVSVTIYKSGNTIGQNAFVDGQHVVERPTAASSSSILEASVVLDSDMYSSQSKFYGNGSELSRNCVSENIQASEMQFTNEKIISDNTISVYASNRQKIVTNVVGASQSDDSETGSASNLSDPSYPAALTDNDIVAAKLQNLSLGKEGPENDSTIVLPGHLQALAADCSHLSFGTYKSGNNSSLTGLLQSNQLKEGDLQEDSTTLDGFPAGHLETRSIVYDVDESNRSFYNTHRAIADARHYDLRSELMKQNVSEASLGSEFIKLSLHDYNVINRANPELSFARTQPNIRNISVQNERTSSNAELGDLLLSHIQSLQGSDHLQSQFPMTQSISSRHSNTEPSISSPTISFSEVRKPPGTFSLSVPSSVLPQHRVAHSYSQPTLPLEQPSNNMIGYSSLPQSYSRLPLTFKQAYAGVDERSLADLKYSLPNYGASMNRFPEVSATAGYGTSSNVPGSYLHTSSASPMINSSYGDVFHPQYKDRNHFTHLEQNSSSSTLNYGPGSRTLSVAQESAFSSSLGQNQQYAGYRQVQQPPQHYGASDYADLYRSQMAMRQEHHQRNLGGLNNGSIQDLLSQQSNQLHPFWQQNH